ncbi:hypothetical protein F4825DRAFT_272870 [Nemania diffusa]|nr:hypothetical protein F4825DRAFT_272870 [Nemania diffusa]
MSRIQQPFSAPLSDPDNHLPATRISFFHPAYADLVFPLLDLATFDVCGDGRIGLDFETARIACGIVACNRWGDDAYFAVKSHEQGEIRWTKIERPECGVLHADTIYYFVVDKPDYRYPVVPSFDHWRFPHGALPPLWEKLSIPNNGRYAPSTGDTDSRSAACIRDGSCCLTGHFEGNEVAHIVPFVHQLWFQSNRMTKYCRVPDLVNPIDDQTNLLLLRADIHSLYDRNRFIFIPKDDVYSGPAAVPTLVVHAVVTKGSLEISQYYHNRPLQSHTAGIRREYLFTRFALSILCDENYRFLSGTHTYAVSLLDDNKMESYIDELDRDAIANRSQIFPPARRTRSVSPKKRKNFPVTQQADEIYQEDDSSCDEETSVECPSDSKERARGRVRRRSPAYYEYQSRYRSGQRCEGDTQCVEPTDDSKSPGGLSFSSTLSVSSLETSRAERISESGIDHDDKAKFAANQISLQQIDTDWDQTDTSTSRPPKRLRMT